MYTDNSPWGAPGNLRYDNGITILECQDFNKPDISCCTSCHIRAKLAHATLSYDTGLLVVRPPRANPQEQGYADFDLLIKAYVCCRLFDYVAGLSHDWWKERAHELKTKEKWNEIRLGHKEGLAGYKEEGYKKVARTQSKLRRPTAEPDERAGDFSKWLGRK